MVFDHFVFFYYVLHICLCVVINIWSPNPKMGMFAVIVYILPFIVCRPRKTNFHFQFSVHDNTVFWKENAILHYKNYCRKISSVKSQVDDEKCVYE
jgi:hypothetical protein